MAWETKFEFIILIINFCNAEKEENASVKTQVRHRLIIETTTELRTDKREYRRVVLKNSLQVLLISDPETDKCAAAMDVGVGSFSDPDGLEGLAHFLEHMLFYASEKYPLEDSYSKYIAEHGGRRNAFTASESTNFHFDVNIDGFEEALDR
ncbi:hypothetical protein SLA2020_148170 [Shorea laevis]